MTRRRTKLDRALEEVSVFNEKHSAGTPVLFWLGLRTDTPEESTTRGVAWALSEGDAVVRVNGRIGGIALTHIEVIPQPAESEVLP